MIKAKKSLGQNFLVDNNIIDKIINSADVYNKNILEIGPGTGNLTLKILEKKPKSLILIEKDYILSNNLRERFKHFKNIKVFNEDILKFDIEKNLKKNTVIIGNLPYNISSQILVKLIKFKKWLPHYEKLVLMFQKEVADKIIAKSESKEFGRISVITSSRLRITDSFQVSPNSFRPIPKIISKVLVLEPFLNDGFKAKDINNLEKITHLFFSMKRKMVNKAFRNLFKDYENISSILKISLKSRPNELSNIDYFNITKIYEDNKT